MASLREPRFNLLMASVLLLALNLRPAMASIGPLAGPILDTTGMGSTGIGMLTMLPVFLMGAGAVGARPIRRMLGEKFGIGLGALVIALSCAARLWIDTSIGLLITAAGAGIGISLIQALVPSFLKRNFASNTGGAIGVFSTGVVTGAAIAAATAAGLGDRLGWAFALAFWGMPALLAAAVWPLASRASLAQARPDRYDAVITQVPFWRLGRSWSLLVFFGIGTGAFMLVMAWLPPFYVGLGQSAEATGYLLGALTIVEALTALGLSMVIRRFPDRRGPLITCLVMVLVGLGCLLINPIGFAIPAVVALGAGIGILFPLSIIVAIDHIDDPSIAGDFTGFVQGGGYILASLIPVAAGAIRDAFADLSQAWILMAVGIAGLIVLALRYSPASYVVFRQSHEREAKRIEGLQFKSERNRSDAQGQYRR